MRVEERGFGVALTPEVRAMVRNVVERSFARLGKRVDEVHVRISSVREGIECRTVLWQEAGPTLATSETRPSMIEALIACANGLARELEQQTVDKLRRSRRQRVARRRRARRGL